MDCVFCRLIRDDTAVWGGDNFSTWLTSRSQHHVEGDPASRLASALALP